MKKINLFGLFLITLFSINASFADCTTAYESRISQIESRPDFEETSPEQVAVQAGLAASFIGYASKWAQTAHAMNHAQFFIVDPKIAVAVATIATSVIIAKEFDLSELTTERESHKDILLLIKQAQRGFGIVIESLHQTLIEKGLDIDLQTLSTQITALNDSQYMCPVDGQLATIKGVEDKIIDMNI